MAESPADTLRRAAALMRERAEAALRSASGRWYVRTPQGEYPQSIYDNASAILVAETFEGPGHPQSTAPFIASMDPSVALAVAAWLESVAMELVDTPPCVTDRRAMSVACAYLNEPDPG